MTSEEVLRATIVFEAVAPDEVEVVYKFLLRLVLDILELFRHCTKIHRLFDDWKEQPLAY